MYKIFDLHNDYFLHKKSTLSKKTYFKNNQKFLDSIATVVWTSELDQDSAMKKIIDANSFVQNNSQTFLAVEDLHFASKNNILEIANMHPAYCGLTWNNNNNLAGGAFDYGDLTEFGKDAIKIFENSDVVVDTAHLNEKSFMTFANITTKSMLCSHTASYALCEHKRNLKDYQVKIICESGGLVGICLVSDFLSGRRQSNILDYVAHIDYLVNKFGIDYFAIGSDFYGTKHLPNKISGYKDLAKQLPEKLEAIGYTKNDINKLFYENAQKFFMKKALE